MSRYTGITIQRFLITHYARTVANNIYFQNFLTQSKITSNSLNLKTVKCCLYIIVILCDNYAFNVSPFRKCVWVVKHNCCNDYNIGQNYRNITTWNWFTNPYMPILMKLIWEIIPEKNICFVLSIVVHVGIQNFGWQNPSKLRIGNVFFVVSRKLEDLRRT